jgi:hypothetical protein
MLALLCTGGGLIAGVAVLARTGRVLPALAVSLDLWTAAGLLRLAGPPSWPRIAAAAVIIALRRLLAAGLRSAAQEGRRPGTRRETRT